MRSALLPLLALASTGCFAVTELDAYTFLDDPCPPAPPECVGGERRVYLQSEFDLQRPQPDGTLDGFDLDGTDLRVCGNGDFTAPDGRAGIDNQTTALALALESVTMENIGETTLAAFLEGDNLALFLLDHVDDLANDDCVRMRFATAGVPADVESPPDYLDADGDRRIDVGLRFDFNTPFAEDRSACIVDGKLYARVDETQTFLGGAMEPQVTVQRARFRFDVSEDRLSNGVMAASFPVELFMDDPDLLAIAERAADLDFDGERCRSLSSGVRIEAVAAELGDRR